MKTNRIIAALIFQTLAMTWLSANLRSQDFSLTTNLASLANLGGIDAGVSYSFSRHWSANANAVYNPFTYREGRENQFQLKERSMALGARYWPWHCYSGMFMDTSARVQEFSEGGILSPLTDEGLRLGLSLAAGYAYMVSDHFNLEMGAGLWGGWSRYSTYSCPRCGNLLSSGEKFFIRPSTVILSLSYIF